MKIFEIISVAFGFLTLAGGIVAIYANMRVNIAKIQTKILAIEKEINDNKIDLKEIIENNKKDNKNETEILRITNQEDHRILNRQFSEIKELIIEKL